jgi:molecular chaperone GrpE
MAEDHTDGRAERDDVELPDTAAGRARSGSAESHTADTDTADETAALGECQARLVRTLADFDNYRRRAARELDQARSAERDRLVVEWIPVIDDLDRALAHAGADPATLVEGVRGVREAAVAVLRRAGVSRVDEVAGPFDPTQHEVGAVVADPGTPAGDVVDLLLPGYEAEDGRVLRPAAVTVSGGQGDGDQQRQ